MPRVFVHCGLHKTGTTALQQFLLAVSPSLLKLGILYPRAGRLDSSPTCSNGDPVRFTQMRESSLTRMSSRPLD